MKKNRLLIAVAGAVVILDEILKNLALFIFPDKKIWLVPNFWQISIHKNFGIAFDLPFDQKIVLVLTVLTIVLLIALTWKKQHSSTWSTTAIGLIVCGALGNLFDRITHGYVIDYLIFFQRSAINLSDTIIIIGAIWLIISQFSRRNKNTVY